MEPREILHHVHAGARFIASNVVNAMAANQMTWEALRIGVGGTPAYAGDDPDPRPVPEWGLAGSRRRQTLDEHSLTELWHEPDVLYFTFGAEHFNFDRRSAVAISTEDLWWLASPGDAIYLTDRLVHHCCGIREVDRENERIHFLEPWPEQFFLKAGMNEAGVAAQDLSISRAEFLRVVLGIETRDTPDLLNLLLASRAHMDNPETLLRAGLALLDDGRERFCREAATFFARALDAATNSGDSQRAHDSAAFCYLALTVAGHRSDAGPHYQRAAAAKIAELEERFSQQALWLQLTADDLARGAYAAAQNQAFDLAGVLFAVALEREPGHQRANYYQGCVAFNVDRHSDAVRQLSIALASNATETAQARLALDHIDPRDELGAREARAELAHQLKMRAEEMRTRALALGQLERWDDALADADALIQLDEEAPEGWQLAGVLHFHGGNVNAARNAFGNALSRTTDAAARAALQAQIENLGTAES